MLTEHRAQTTDPFLVQTNPIPPGLATSLSGHPFIQTVQAQAYLHQRFWPKGRIIFKEHKWSQGNVWICSWNEEKEICKRNNTHSRSSVNYHCYRLFSPEAYPRQRSGYKIFTNDPLVKERVGGSMIEQKEQLDWHCADPTKPWPIQQCSAMSTAYENWGQNGRDFIFPSYLQWCLPWVRLLSASEYTLHSLLLKGDLRGTFPGLPQSCCRKMSSSVP